MKHLLGIIAIVLASHGSAGAAPAEDGALDRAVDAVTSRITGAELETIARGTLGRARRAVAIGPTVGAWGAHVPSADVQEVAVTFGVAAEVFAIPVLPSAETFRTVLEERVRAKLRAAITARFRGEVPEPLALEQLASEAFAEAKAELLANANTRAKVWERPRFSAGLEANRLLEAEAWLARLRLGVGIWKLTLAGSFAVGFGDDTTVFTGVELATHVLPTRGPRSPVIDVFVRADFEVTDRDANTDHVTLGARLLLDVL